MRAPTVGRSVVKNLAPLGQHLVTFYRLVHTERYPEGAVRYLDDYLGPYTNQPRATHEWERECTVDRPLVFVVGDGRLGRMTKGDDGYHRVEFDILAVTNA